MKYVVVTEDTYKVTGPFKSEQLVGDALKKRGFRDLGQGRWIFDSKVFQEVRFVRVRPVLSLNEPETS